MISVIVPVYNEELYLRECLDSIVGQTNRDLEILVIDDGSTDGSGQICDEYAELDSRIKVFHTENRGLSCARNLGLDNANGEWIGFVDSDDWIEPDMYEVLLKKALETGADVVECGVFKEYPDRIEEYQRNSNKKTGIEAIYALIITQELSDGVWSKLWSSHCFEGIRFPNGRIYEDIAVTYRLFEIAEYVCTVDRIEYHYCLRDGSITKRRDLKNLIDYYIAQRERFEYLINSVDSTTSRELLRRCAVSIGRTWAGHNDYSRKEWGAYQNIINEMNDFTISFIPLFGYREWHWDLRIGTFFPHFNNTVSFRLAWITYNLHRIIKNMDGIVSFLR